MIRLSAFADEISAQPEEQLSCLCANGVHNVEFRSIHGTNVLDLSPNEHEAFRDLLRLHGMGVSAIGSPIGKIGIKEPFEPHLERFAKAMELADFYHTPLIRVFSYYIPADADPASFRDEVMHRMRAKAERACERGLTLVLENEKGIYGDTALRVADILRTVNSPALKHAFDPANYVEVGQDVIEAWHLLHPWVAHFHVKDYDRTSHRNVPAGQGDGRIPELLADAVAHGYEGFAVLEPHLVIAEKSYGFTGPERFGEASIALKESLAARGLDYA